jgi:hypothetical protein
MLLIFSKNISANLGEAKGIKSSIKRINIFKKLKKLD